MSNDNQRASKKRQSGERRMGEPRPNTATARYRCATCHTGFTTQAAAEKHSHETQHRRIDNAFEKERNQ